MLPFGIGFSEILLVMIVLLLVVGPQKLPELAKSLGKGVRVARRASDELKAAVAVDEINSQRPWEQDDAVDDVVADTHDYEAVDDEHHQGDSSSERHHDPANVGGLSGSEKPLIESGEGTEAEEPPDHMPVARDPQTVVRQPSDDSLSASEEQPEGQGLQSQENGETVADGPVDEPNGSASQVQDEAKASVAVVGNDDETIGETGA